MSGTKPVREAGATRGRILASAFEEFHLRGFQAGSLDAIVARAGVTKGALYHHFPDKTALGYAVVEEVVHAPLLEAYLGPLRAESDDPLAVIQDVLRRRADDFLGGGVELGCPLNNLAQEMSALDDGFRGRVAATLEEWTNAFATALTRAQERGCVRPDIDARRVAALIVAAVEGSFGTAKNARSLALLRSNLEMLAEFLESLRPRPVESTTA